MRQSTHTRVVSLAQPSAQRSLLRPRSGSLRQEGLQNQFANAVFVARRRAAHPRDRTIELDNMRVWYKVANNAHMN